MKDKKKLRLLSFVLTFTMIVSNFFTNFTTLVAKAEELNKNVVIENFEKLKKSGYTEADVELETGSWKFNNAMAGNQEPDKKIDSTAARIKSEGFIAMNFDVANVKEIILSHAYYSKDSGSTLKIQKSTDSGVSWVDVGSSNAITSDLKEEKFVINEAGNVRFKINVVGTKDKRINIDNFTIVHNDGTVEQIALTGLRIDESLALEVGESKGLTLAYIPENTTEKGVEYTSLNPEIATVDKDGKVTAVKEGETTIEVKSMVKADIKATCKVTVTKGIDKVGPTVSNLKPASGQNIGDLRRPEISATFQDETGVDMTSIKLSIDGQIVSGNIVKEGNTIKYLVDKDLSDGAHTVLVEVKDTLGNLATQEWKFTIGEQNKNLYFGQLHSHTNISDGTGTIDEAYQYAENNAKVDFLAVTDHSNWFDNDKLANISDGSKSEAWKKGLNAADKYNKDGDFVAIYGYEMTWSGSTGGYGHMNTFNTPGFETRTNSKMDLKNYYNTLKTQKQSLSQLNHPGKTFGDFSDFAHYDAEIDKQVTLIEVGNGEGAIRSSGYFPSYEYYTRALDKGWHVAPTNNQDNHKGRWGNANTARTVIEAPNLSRESVYEAIRERRVYATEDENLKISYEVNGNTMGSILGKTDSLDFKVNVDDMDSGDTIKKISIIGDGGKVVKSIDNVNSTTKEWTFKLDQSVSSYYYVRVDQSDRDIAVTSAIWAGERENVGISTVDSDTEVIVAGEEFNIGTTIYNNEAVAINNVKVEYYLNNGTEAIKTETIDSIASGSTAVAKLPYKFDKAGDYSFQVKVTATINGVEREFKGAKEVSVLGANEVSKVVIDGAHQNQYVSGDYSGKVTTLTALMAQNNVKAVINKEPITDEVLKGASLLVLSDPQSKAVSSSGLSPQKYTSDELAAIARFIEKGGNIAITSKADYGDATGEYGNAEQGNSVLKAIGAKIRFNDDQATDDVENGGQNFRLYFNDYNTESSWLNGIDTTKKYSFYSGSTLIMPKDASNIDILVKGHSTTYGNDADKQGDNTAVNKGEVVGLAVETLSSGAKVVVSGATFFSNFEMDGLDYSNYQITEKVIKELAAAPEIPVSKISSVRIDENKDNTPDRFGETVVVEGYVTAASNVASPGNSFFDVIYVEDDTAGLTVFGVSTTSVKLGQKVRIKGKVSSYLGDAQVALKNESLGLQIIDENINLVEPTKLSTKDSMLEEKEGLLVKVEGTVTRIEGQNIFVNDGTGESRVYVEGYIGSSKNPGVADEWKTRINVGDKVSAIGLASEDPEGHRLRVRDSAEIEKLPSDDVEITVLHTNDTHGRVKGDSNVIGIDTISAIKKSIPNSILLDAGDTLHGLPFATMNKGEDIVTLMKMAGYDIMTPGNHDFNYGYERLLELANKASEGNNGFPIISSNVMKGDKTLLNTNIIKEIDGVKVGFFGLSTPETAYKTNPNNVKGLNFNDPIESAKKQVEELKSKGADVIIAIAHIGTDESSEITSPMIAKAVEGIDVIVDGHSHSKYPTGLEAENGTIIVSTGEYEANIGQVKITVDKETKKVTNKIATLIPKSTASTIKADEAVTAKIKEIDDAQNVILSKVIGNSKVTLDGARENVRTKETNLGNLITDSMIYTTSAEIAITNGGGMRDSINEGEITKGEVIKVLPFGNFIVTKYLTGLQIKEILEHGIKAYPATAGQFPHVSGIKYVFDKDKEAGNRIISITMNGKALDMDKKYLVATNDFMSAGGDGYPHFKDAKTENEFQALDESLEAYIKKLGDVNYSVEGRIVVGKNSLPTITAKDLTLTVGDEFNPLKDITAVDLEDGDLTDKIQVIENTVDTSKAGEYKIIYQVKDSRNEVTTKEIKVIVKEKEVPVVKVTGVSLDKTSAELKVNETLELKATITPLDATNKEVTWASSDEKVAKVDENGKVTAIGAGKVTITVTTRDGNFKATSEITVKAKETPVVKVTGVSLDKTSAELKVNETLELKATITPADATNKEVTWTSSDEKVAKVDENGKVVAVGSGKATITVTTKDGNFKATAEITVKESELPVIKVTGVSLDKTSAELKVNETLELKATITPADATNKEVTWASSDERVAKVDANGKVTAIGKGKAIITVTTKDGNFKATVEITVKAEDSGNGGNTSGNGGNTSGNGGITLPSTGGNNPMYGLIVALIIVGVGAFMVLRKKKKEVKEK